MGVRRGRMMPDPRCAWIAVVDDLLFVDGASHAGVGHVRVARRHICLASALMEYRPDAISLSLGVIPFVFIRTGPLTVIVSIPSFLYPSGVIAYRFLRLPSVATPHGVIAVFRAAGRNDFGERFVHVVVISRWV